MEENVENNERSEIDRLKAENKVLTEKISMLQKRCKGAETVANSAKKQLIDKNNELLKVKDELRRVNEELKKLKGDQALQYLTEQIEMYKEEIKNKEKRIAELLKDRNFLLERQQINEKENERLTIDNLKWRSKNGAAEINRLKQEISNLREQMRYLEARCEELAKQADTPGGVSKENKSTQCEATDFDPFSLFNSENINFLENYNKIENRKNDNIIDLSEGEDEKKGV